MGSSLPTMDDVANRAGVSRALVSLVMRDSPKVSETSRAAVLAAAAAIGYRPNLIARNLASHQTMTIGVFLDDLHNPYYAEIADGLLATAYANGYQTLITTGRRRPDEQERAIQTLFGMQTDGLILLSPRFPLAIIESLATNVPVVAVAEPLKSDDIDTVSNDERVGARLVIDHLVNLGHRNILHIDGGEGPAATMRLRAFRRVMKIHGLDPGRRLSAGEFTEAGGERATDELLRSAEAMPTAIFAANDLIATGVLDRLDDTKLRVPRDLSLIGYDNTALATMRRMSLTTVDQQRVAIGQLAVETLIDRIKSGRPAGQHHVLAPSLVVRKTTAAPRR